MQRARMIAIKLCSLAGKLKRRTSATSQTSWLTQTRCKSTWNLMTGLCSNETSILMLLCPNLRCFRTLTFELTGLTSVSYTHLRAHETDSYLVCRLLLEKKKKKKIQKKINK